MDTFHSIRLIKREPSLIEAWVLVENIKCQVLELFGNSYYGFTVQQQELFINHSPCHVN